jgi:hypothetical protein
VGDTHAMPAVAEQFDFNLFSRSSDLPFALTTLKDSLGTFLLRHYLALHTLLTLKFSIKTNTQTLSQWFHCAADIEIPCRSHPGASIIG